MSQWLDRGVAPAWQAAHVYAEGDVILGVSSLVWMCYSAGTSGATEPNWASGPPILDNGIVGWFVIGDWFASSNYPSGEPVQPTTQNTHWYTAMASGTSGTTQPTWPTNGTSVNDGGTGGSDGELIIPDDTDNDDDTGAFAGAVESTLLFQVWENPAKDRDEPPVGVLTRAYDRTIRAVFNAAGEGALTINRHDDEAAWLVADRIVVVYRESLDNAPFFAFILETTEEVAVSEDEDGGDEIRWKGRGVMAILERACLWYRSVLPNGADLGALPQDDRDGMWHWTDRPPGAILVRQLEEARQRGTFYGGGIQDCAIPNVYWTFGRGHDSIDEDWDNSAGALFKLPVGDNLYYEVLPKLMQCGLLLRALPVINGDGHLRTKLSAWTDDPGVATGIVFEKGVNIAESAEKVKDSLTGYTDVLVQGDISKSGSDSGTYKYAVTGDDAFRPAVGRREGFLPFHSTPTSSLMVKAGDKLIRQGKRKHAGPTTLEVIERTDEVAFVDYFPGDYVTVNIPDVWEMYTDNLDEILMTEQENGTFSVGIQFASDDPIGVVDVPADSCCASEPSGES